MRSHSSKHNHKQLPKIHQRNKSTQCVRARINDTTSNKEDNDIVVKTKQLNTDDSPLSIEVFNVDDCKEKEILKTPSPRAPSTVSDICNAIIKHKIIDKTIEEIMIDLMNDSSRQVIACAKTLIHGEKISTTAIINGSKYFNDSFNRLSSKLDNILQSIGSDVDDMLKFKIFCNCLNVTCDNLQFSGLRHLDLKSIDQSTKDLFRDNVNYFECFIAECLTKYDLCSNDEANKWLQFMTSIKKNIHQEQQLNSSSIVTHQNSIWLWYTMIINSVRGCVASKLLSSTIDFMYHCTLIQFFSGKAFVDKYGTDFKMTMRILGIGVGNMLKDNVDSILCEELLATIKTLTYHKISMNDYYCDYWDIGVNSNVFSDCVVEVGFRILTIVGNPSNDSIVKARVINPMVSYHHQFQHKLSICDVECDLIVILALNSNGNVNVPAISTSKTNNISFGLALEFGYFIVCDGDSVFHLWHTVSIFQNIDVWLLCFYIKTNCIINLKYLPVVTCIKNGTDFFSKEFTCNLVQQYNKKRDYDENYNISHQIIQPINIKNDINDIVNELGATGFGQIRKVNNKKSFEFIEAVDHKFQCQRVLMTNSTIPQGSRLVRHSYSNKADFDEMMKHESLIALYALQLYRNQYKGWIFIDKFPNRTVQIPTNLIQCNDECGICFWLPNNVWDLDALCVLDENQSQRQGDTFGYRVFVWLWDQDAKPCNFGLFVQLSQTYDIQTNNASLLNKILKNEMTDNKSSENVSTNDFNVLFEKFSQKKQEGTDNVYINEIINYFHKLTDDDQLELFARCIIKACATQGFGLLLQQLWFWIVTKFESQQLTIHEKTEFTIVNQCMNKSINSSIKMTGILCDKNVEWEMEYFSNQIIFDLGNNSQCLKMNFLEKDKIFFMIDFITRYPKSNKFTCFKIKPDHSIPVVHSPISLIYLETSNGIKCLMCINNYGVGFVVAFHCLRLPCDIYSNKSSLYVDDPLLSLIGDYIPTTMSVANQKREDIHHALVLFDIVPQIRQTNQVKQQISQLEGWCKNQYRAVSCTRVLGGDKGQEMVQDYQQIQFDRRRSDTKLIALIGEFGNLINDRHMQASVYNNWLLGYLKQGRGIENTSNEIIDLEKLDLSQDSIEKQLYNDDSKDKDCDTCPIFDIITSKIIINCGLLHYLCFGCHTINLSIIITHKWTGWIFTKHKSMVIYPRFVKQPKLVLGYFAFDITNIHNPCFIGMLQFKDKYINFVTANGFKSINMKTIDHVVIGWPFADAPINRSPKVTKSQIINLILHKYNESRLNEVVSWFEYEIQRLLDCLVKFLRIDTNIICHTFTFPIIYKVSNCKWIGYGFPNYKPNHYKWIWMYWGSSFKFSGVFLLSQTWSEIIIDESKYVDVSKMINEDNVNYFMFLVLCIVLIQASVSTKDFDQVWLLMIQCVSSFDQSINEQFLNELLM